MKKAIAILVMMMLLVSAALASTEDMPVDEIILPVGPVQELPVGFTVDTSRNFMFAIAAISGHNLEIVRFMGIDTNGDQSILCVERKVNSEDDCMVLVILDANCNLKAMIPMGTVPVANGSQEAPTVDDVQVPVNASVKTSAPTSVKTASVVAAKTNAPLTASVKLVKASNAD